MVSHHAPKISVIPGWVLAAIGLFSRELGAIREMLYQWEQPYVLDDSRFIETFGVGATPIDEALRATLGLEAAATAA